MKAYEFTINILTVRFKSLRVIFGAGPYIEKMRQRLALGNVKHSLL